VCAEFERASCGTASKPEWRKRAKRVGRAGDHPRFGIILLRYLRCSRERAAGSLGHIPLIVLTRDPQWSGDTGTPVDLQPIIEGV
jgi:hypothetical protein